MHTSTLLICPPDWLTNLSKLWGSLQTQPQHPLGFLFLIPHYLVAKVMTQNVVFHNHLILERQEVAFDA